MILKYVVKNNKKLYTLKPVTDNQKTQDAHYKFIKIRSLKE